MKFYPIIFLFAIILSSCKKKEPATPSSNSSPYFITATIAGQKEVFTSNVTYGFNPNHPNYISIVGHNYNGTYSAVSRDSSIGFTIVNYYHGYVGTYKLGYCNPSTYPPNNSSANYSSVSDIQQFGEDILFSYSTDSIHTGTLTITAFDSTAQTLSGTFSFEGYWQPTVGTIDSITISNGTFFAHLQQ